MESDLVGLRAELHKKRVEASKYGAIRKGLVRKKHEKPSKSGSFNYQNAGVAIRDFKDKQQERNETPSEEKSRSALEKKAQLYEKLHSGIETLESDELNEKYLVNFQRKIVDEVNERKRVREAEEEVKAKQQEREERNPGDYKPKGKGEEWVEYTDVLGRTRECMRKDLPAMVEQDKNLLEDDKDEAAYEEELISGEKHRGKLHEKWEQEAEINAFKKDLHYQDVMYNEARQHGTGYMKFSTDEKERTAQLNMLKEMHEEARRSEQSKKIVESKKQKLLKARLEKVRQRKRLKLGLPIKGDDKLKTPPVSDDEDEVIGPPVPSSQNENEKAKLDNEKEDILLRENKCKVREWDVMNVGAREFSTLSQEEWVNCRRKQRIEEFAPPALYSSSKNHKGKNQKANFQKGVSTSNNSFEENEDRQLEKRKYEFAPPSTFEYHGPSSIAGKKKYSRPSYKSMEETVAKGLSNLRKTT